MPLKKITLKPGVNRENTRLTTEGGWYESDKIRFRQGTPETIGGWERLDTNTFQGICRSLWAWVTLAGTQLIGVGTHLKFYVKQPDAYYDITPIRLMQTAATLTNPFATTDTSTTVTVTDAAHGLATNDYVVFSGASTTGGVPSIDFNTLFKVTYVGVNSYTITVADPATATVVAGGGTVSVARYKASAPVLTDPFTTSIGLAVVTVTDAAHGAIDGDFVTFSGASAVGGLTLNGEYQITYVDVNTYTITAGSTASASATGGGTVTATYQINTGLPVVAALYGWGAGTWGEDVWGHSLKLDAVANLRLWSQSNYGEDLVFSHRNGPIYYWDATNGTGTRAVNLAFVDGARYVPTTVLTTLVSDVYRFVLAFGCNDIDSQTLNPLLIRWSDMENALDWYPEATNQAGSLPLSQGSEIVAAYQVRQEIMVWTDVALYTLQYLGGQSGWGATLMDSSTSCASPRAMAMAAGIVLWMGKDKFYKYDGRVQTLRCDLRGYIFKDFNSAQASQVFAASNESFNEVWWFYCSSNSTTIDRYAVYNYLEDIWYYGTMARTAWLDRGLNDYPVAATYSYNLVQHEFGVDDRETGTPAPLNAYIISSQFDIDDGHNFSFIWRLLPDISFAASSSDASDPHVTLTLYPLKNSGSGYSVPPSVAGSSSAAVTRIGVYQVDQFTGQINTRVRARQLSIGVSSNTLGTAWQLGSPRMDIKPDGRA